MSSKKQPKEEVLGPNIRVQKVRSAREILENMHVSLDIPKPKARTFMTPGRFKKPWSEEFRAKFSFPFSSTPGHGRHSMSDFLHMARGSRAKKLATLTRREENDQTQTLGLINWRK